jgi:MYXO-CTERM domain-containing protein
MRLRAAASLALGALLFAPAAWATVTEPNGLVVPRDSANGEEQLYTFFQAQGESIAWQQDASTQPDVFSPLCGFKATFMLNQAGSHFGLAWYNVDPNATQPPSALYTIAPANTPVGTVFTGADIRQDPNYAGALIGFALIGGQTHYSEAQWNVNCTSCSPPGPWILSLTYKSTKIANAYYLAFEDGNVTASSFNNDGDYNDDVYLLEGLECVGGGQQCDTGQPGACEQGVTQCSTGGSVTCTQIVQPGPEKCDGLDNDCNGLVDDGDNLCQAGYVCDKGSCVKACSGGEFPCAGNKICSNGYCIDPSCASVTCPSGQVCVGGKCKGPCDGVTCPAGQVCRAGACVDPCSGVTCPQGQVCSGGGCVMSCTCQPCGSGLACDATSGQCVDPGCVGKQCQAGTVCQAGQCVDPCAGAVCPSGQICQDGNCVANPNGSGGSDAGAAGDGGIVIIGSGGSSGASGGSANGGAGDGFGAGEAYGQEEKANSSSGCGCRVASVQGGESSAGLLGLLAAAWLLSERRRKARR